MCGARQEVMPEVAFLTSRAGLGTSGSTGVASWLRYLPAPEAGQGKVVNSDTETEELRVFIVTAAILVTGDLPGSYTENPSFLICNKK